jgi:hypothetical protein
VYSTSTQSVTGTTSPLWITGLSGGTTYSCYILSYLDSVLGSTSSGLSVTTSDTTVAYTNKVTMLLVGGGGGGFSGAGLGTTGGGGGGGGVVYGTIALNPGVTYTIVVGSGGSYVSTSSPYITGGNTYISGTNLTTVIARGGGSGGGSAQSYGGCGGGVTNSTSAAKSTQDSYTSIYSGLTSYGNAGGSNVDGSGFYGSGGGGAGGAGGSYSSGDVSGGYGGPGVLINITGTATYYAGGGGGAKYGSNVYGGRGGAGGGGNAPVGSSSATSGTTNTGGGGGASAYGISGTAGNGGSGVAIISVPTSYLGTYTGTTSVSTNGSYTVITYTSGTGTYTPYSYLTYVNDISGLVVYYKFESMDTSNNSYYVYNYAQSAYDASFTAYTGTTYPSISTTYYKVGSGSLSFNSTYKQQMRIGYGFYPSSAGMSVSFWVYDTGSSVYARWFILMNNSTQSSYNMCIYKESTSWYFNSGSNVKIATTTTINSNTWYHIALTITSSGSAKMYVNGSLDSTGTLTYPSTSTLLNYNWLSRSTDSDAASSYGWMSGYIDDFRIYNGTVLSSSQVSQIYSEASVSALTTLSSTSITTLDTSSVQLSWAATNASYYVIYNQTNGVTYGLDATITSSPYTIDSLTYGNKYNFYIIPYSSSYAQGTPSQTLTNSYYLTYAFSKISTFDTTGASDWSTYCSYTGQYMYSVSNSSTVYYSSDYGDSWSSTTVTSNMMGVCCSWDGSIVYVTGGGYIHKSTKLRCIIYTITIWIKRIYKTSML